MFATSGCPCLQPITACECADIYQLVQAIHELGGAKKVEDDNLWEEVVAEMGLSDVSNAKYNISTQYKKHLRWVLHPEDVNDDQEWAAQHNMPPLQDEFDIPAPPAGMDAASALWYCKSAQPAHGLSSS